MTSPKDPHWPPDTARLVTDRELLEPIHAEALRWLVERGHAEIAMSLARARLVRVEDGEAEEEPIGDGYYFRRRCWLEADGVVRSALQAGCETTLVRDEKNVVVEYVVGIVQQAFDAATPLPPPIGFVVIDIEIVAPTDEVGRHQGDLYPGPGKIEYGGRRYRSRTETRIAQVLDDLNVLYLPLPTAVRHHQRVEPDFVVVSFGRIGVLEIDGPHHTPLTRAREDARASWLLQSGVRLVHHVAVGDVDRDAEGVVRGFLALLHGPTL